jgi:LacI family transcriptional regulator
MVTSKSAPERAAMRRADRQTLTGEMTNPRSPSAPARRVTLRDVAKVAGVSEPTASRSLRGEARISARTREIVRQVADQLGYIPNATARNLAKRMSETLALMVPDVTDPVHGQVVSGFEAEATRRGYVLLVCNSRYNPETEARGLYTLVGSQADGIAIFGSVLDPASARSMYFGASRVLICPEHLSELQDSDLPGRIKVDDAAGITEVVNRAVSAGYRRFGYLNGPAVASAVRRRNAAAAELKVRGLERLRVYEYEGMAVGAVATRIVQDGCDLILCFDDQRALRLLSALQIAGVGVPEQIGVVGFDDIPFAAISNPPLSTVAALYEEIGRLACTMLLDQLATGVPAPSVTLRPQVVFRGTTAIQLRLNQPGKERATKVLDPSG